MHHGPRWRLRNARGRFRGAALFRVAFAESTAELVEEYRLDGNFQNQWGLSHIKADVAYSNLSLLKGEDAEPGAGVTIGFIDTGIDLDHPAFAAKTAAAKTAAADRCRDDRHRGIHAGRG